MAEFDLTKLLANFPPPETAADMRRMIDGFAGFMNADLPAVGAFHSSVRVSDAVTADVVVPKGAGPFPILVYLHGGGWVCGSPKTHRKLGYRFAEAGFLVVNVDYRLAPEHAFPTPLEDCLAAVRWASREAARWNGDATRMAIGGDSAGGNLAAATAAALHGSDLAPKAALLIYGVFDFASLESDGAIFEGAGAGISPEAGTKLLRLMVESYLGASPSAQTLADPRVSPVRAAHRLPPAHVVVGGADPLVRQARALGEQLASAGVEHELVIDEGMPHGYVQMEFLPAARPAIDRMIAFLRKHL
jgi:acetyl esterase